MSVVFFLELKNISTTPTKQDLLGVLFKISNGQPRRFYMGVPPHPRARVLIARVRRLNNYELKDARKFLLLTVSNCRSLLEWEFPLFQKRLRMQESPGQRSNEEKFLLDFDAKKKTEGNCQRLQRVTMLLQDWKIMTWDEKEIQKYRGPAA